MPASPPSLKASYVLFTRVQRLASPWTKDEVIIRGWKAFRGFPTRCRTRPGRSAEGVGWLTHPFSRATGRRLKNRTCVVTGDLFSTLPPNVLVNEAGATVNEKGAMSDDSRPTPPDLPPPPTRDVPGLPTGGSIAVTIPRAVRSGWYLHRLPDRSCVRLIMPVGTQPGDVLRFRTPPLRPERSSTTNIA